jgi:hypothetical protein
MTKKIILFELNEVPWRVIDDFVQDHPRSCLARLLPTMRTFRTYAEDTALSPWITWPTLHRGVSDEQHTVSDFGQDLAEINAAYPSVWEILVRNGVSTGVCGSLHSYPLPPNAAAYAFFIPDVFAAGSECFPPAIETFQAFNLEMSRGSARNVSSSVPWRKAWRVLAGAPGLGLRPSTLLDVGRQLAHERRQRWVRVRRRTFQVVLAFDIFMKQLQATQPAFSTFFTNHVASTMHRYWAARYPDDYEQFAYGREWVDTYRHEIAWTMSRFDAMLARLADFVERHPDYALWIATSMGQAATAASEVQTQVYLTDVARFMRRLGFGAADWTVRPAMLPRVIIALQNGRAGEFEAKLQTIQIGDRGPLPFKRLDAGVFRIHPGALQNVRDEFCRLAERRVPFAELGFANVPIEDSAGQSAYHVPHGALMIHAARQPAADQTRTEISTLDVAPMILASFGIAAPPYMRGHPAAAMGVPGAARSRPAGVAAAI